MEAWSCPDPTLDSGATGAGRQFLFYRPAPQYDNFRSRPRRLSLHGQHLGPQRPMAPPSLVLQVLFPWHAAGCAAIDSWRAPTCLDFL